MKTLDLQAIPAVDLRKRETFPRDRLYGTLSPAAWKKTNVAETVAQESGMTTVPLLQNSRALSRRATLVAPPGGVLQMLEVPLAYVGHQKHYAAVKGLSIFRDHAQLFRIF